MRPGYGRFNSNVVTAATELGMPIINWTLRGESIGSRYFTNTREVSNHVLNNVRGNEIVLLHDTYADIVDATDRIITELTRRGYQFVTVSEFLLFTNTNPRPGQVVGQTTR
jgi:peptidoglycan/xylan/chitin deacetylase (PgdA/CDA1 family)